MTTHPLAKQAAEKIIDDPQLPHFSKLDDILMTEHIHTTAVQPILDKGDLLEGVLLEATSHYPSDCGGCYICEALKSWRDLKAGYGEPTKTDS